jgi:hypothetical protein
MPIVATPQLYAIMSQANPETLGGAIRALFPGEHLQLGPGQWLLVASGTTAKELSDKLGITTGQNGTAVIVTGTSYYGRGRPEIWEWIKSKLGNPIPTTAPNPNA